jgi:hypothetical protein
MQVGDDAPGQRVVANHAAGLERGARTRELRLGGLLGAHRLLALGADDSDHQLVDNELLLGLFLLFLSNGDGGSDLLATASWLSSVGLKIVRPRRELCANHDQV